MPDFSHSEMGTPLLRTGTMPVDLRTAAVGALPEGGDGCWTATAESDSAGRLWKSSTGRWAHLRRRIPWFTDRRPSYPEVTGSPFFFVSLCHSIRNPWVWPSKLSCQVGRLARAPARLPSSEDRDPVPTPTEAALGDVNRLTRARVPLLLLTSPHWRKRCLALQVMRLLPVHR